MWRKLVRLVTFQVSYLWGIVLGIKYIIIVLLALGAVSDSVPPAESEDLAHKLAQALLSKHSSAPEITRRNSKVTREFQSVKENQMQLYKVGDETGELTPALARTPNARFHSDTWTSLVVDSSSDVCIASLSSATKRPVDFSVRTRRFNVEDVNDQAGNSSGIYEVEGCDQDRIEPLDASKGLPGEILLPFSSESEKLSSSIQVSQFEQQNTLRSRPWKEDLDTVLQKDFNRWEALWAAELTDLRMKCVGLQHDLAEERENVRIMRSELAKRDAEMAAMRGTNLLDISFKFVMTHTSTLLQASMQLANRNVESANAKAEREALSTGII